MKHKLITTSRIEEGLLLFKDGTAEIGGKGQSDGLEGLWWQVSINIAWQKSCKRQLLQLIQQKVGLRNIEQGTILPVQQFQLHGIKMLKNHVTNSKLVFGSARGKVTY